MAEVLEYRGRRWRNGRGAAHRPTAAEPGELADHSPTRRIRKRSITNVRRGPPHQFTTWQTDATSTPEPNMKFMILVKSNPDLEAVWQR